MAKIVRATAIANNEVAFLAWGLDVDPLPECLGFHIVREHLEKKAGKLTVVEERPLASYVAFKGQRNPDMAPQNTTVWPVQKFTWRDLTIRRRRNGEPRRPAEQLVRYRIRGVGKMRDGLETVDVIPTTNKDDQTENTYEGKPIPLGYLTDAVWTNEVLCTAKRPPFTSTFTNGILSTQFLVHVLQEDGTISAGELKDHLTTENDWLRNYLSGDVLPLIRDFFGQPGGRFRAALYELEDDELQGLLEEHADRLDLILSDAGETDTKTGGVTVSTYDTRNQPARKALQKLAKKPGATFTLQNRFFNGSGHIGHNKFVVHVDDQGRADSVLTGSTNWTWSGVSGQSNNCIRIDDRKVAKAFLDYWGRLAADAWEDPKPQTARVKDGGQFDPLKEANQTPRSSTGAKGTKFDIWFSPNVPQKKQPPSGGVAPPPPDMEALFSLMRKAKRAILFAVFLPSKQGRNSVISEAVRLGQLDTSLDVIGAISDSQAMWRGTPLGAAVAANAHAPRVFKAGGVSVVLASALTDKTITGQLGDFELAETISAGKAIIHDKIVVIDPMDAEDCVVAFGSHNLGYKASYSNDENLVIVRGHQALAQAYATHILDVYDHYRFRAAEADANEDPSGSKQWNGFLAKTDAWQKKSSHRLADYFAPP